MTGTSPPGPFRCGSTTCKHEPGRGGGVEGVAALSRTAIPAAEASQWVEATIPNVPASSGLVVNSGTVGHNAAPSVSGYLTATIYRHTAAVRKLHWTI